MTYLWSTSPWSDRNACFILSVVFCSRGTFIPIGVFLVSCFFFFCKLCFDSWNCKFAAWCCQVRIPLDLILQRVLWGNGVKVLSTMNHCLLCHPALTHIFNPTFFNPFCWVYMYLPQTIFPSPHLPFSLPPSFCFQHSYSLHFLFSSSFLDSAFSTP